MMCKLAVNELERVLVRHDKFSDFLLRQVYAISGTERRHVSIYYMVRKRMLDRTFFGFPGVLTSRSVSIKAF